MEISIAEQLTACFANSVLGIGAALLYTSLRIVYVILFGEGRARRNIVGRVPEFFFDLVFCLITCIAAAITSYAFSYGQNRAVNLIFAAAGFTLFMLTLGRLILALTEMISRTVRRAISRIVGLLMRPVRAAVRVVSAFLGWAFGRTLGALIVRIAERRADRQVEKAVKKYIPLYVSFDGMGK